MRDACVTQKIHRLPVEMRVPSQVAQSVFPFGLEREGPSLHAVGHGQKNQVHQLPKLMPHSVVNPTVWLSSQDRPHSVAKRN